MIHVRALPGTPRYAGSMARIVDQAGEEADLYHRAGVTALAIENMHDRPYLLGEVGPEIVAAMTAVGIAVRSAAPSAPLGVQILAGAMDHRRAVAAARGRTMPPGSRSMAPPARCRSTAR